MTKLIGILAIALLAFGGWQFFLYWERVKDEEVMRKKQEQTQVNPGYLEGMPPALETSLQQATEKGSAGLKAWLATYGTSLQDPRKAWIELDYAVALSREQPAEARRIFSAVKSRTPETSPVYSRVKQLEKTYE